MMLDTFIGANDGVPFVIPGQKDLLTDMRNFSEKEIPDYIEALENPDPANPGTVAHIRLERHHDPKGHAGACQPSADLPLARQRNPLGADTRSNSLH